MLHPTPPRLPTSPFKAPSPGPCRGGERTGTHIPQMAVHPSSLPLSWSHPFLNLLHLCVSDIADLLSFYDNVKWTKPAPRVSFQSLPHSKTVSLWEVPLDFLAVDSLIRPDQISGAAKPHPAPVILAPVPMSLFTLSFLQTKTEIQQDGEIIMTSQTVPRLCQCRITALWLLWSVPRAT